MEWNGLYQHCGNHRGLPPLAVQTLQKFPVATGLCACSQGYDQPGADCCGTSRRNAMEWNSMAESFPSRLQPTAWSRQMADDFFRSRSDSRLPDDLSPTQPGNSILGRCGYDGHRAAWLAVVVADAIHAIVVQGPASGSGTVIPPRSIGPTRGSWCGTSRPGRHGMEFHG